ncbi:hypothetical protein EDD38_5522 [Kitasatospora cineracea]|uniref:Ferritin-like domain-containing protein n=1 Tax=Kitasatospora cineracea TaxID=88074 RepID=A0A3N4S9B9_9ACTN|nr:hypothetical protein EDD38_5522 [Kitasatospora cineracea]
MALLSHRGLPPLPVPDELDYVGRSERAGIGVAHTKLREGTPLGTEGVIAYLARGRVTEQRGAEDMRAVLAAFDDLPEMHCALKVICRDEERHLAHCHEELLRLTGEGHGPLIRTALRRAARTEIRIYRDVSTGVLERVAAQLGWHPAERLLLLGGLRAAYAVESRWRWRRLVTLRMPELRNALGDSADHRLPDPSTEAG